MAGIIVRKMKKKAKKKVLKIVGGFMLSAVGFYFFISILIIIVICGSVICAASSNPSPPNPNPSKNLPEAVEAYRPMMTEVAAEYNVSEYIDLFLAIMAAESGGKGTDVMCSSESGYNTKYPHSPGAIQEPRYSIECGVQTIRDTLQSAEVTGAKDIPHIRVALQGYNFGNGYVADAKSNTGGLWEQEHVYDFARRYSKGIQRTPGTAIYERAGPWAYGDQHYPDHVLIYYNTGGGGGSTDIIKVALEQLGNVGGEPYWSWYGFTSRVEWCACFVSWCANQCGYIEKGVIPKFSYCPSGAQWFQSNGQWKNAGEIPNAGDVIFFNWDGGEIDHVGLVESYEEGMVHTIEGNSGDECKQRNYSLDSRFIAGYGTYNTG